MGNDATGGWGWETTGAARLAVIAVGLLLALVIFASRGSGPPPADSTGASSPAHVAGDYGRLPLAFAPAPPGARGFAASTDAGSVVLGRRGATIAPAARGAVPVRMSLAGAAASVPRAEKKLPGVVNDLRGDDPSKWRTEVPTFARVSYPGVYPGTAIDFHGTSGTLEYDFRLAPGADPGRIAINFHGAPVRVADSGALIVGDGAGRVRQAPPVAYQPGSQGRERVPASFSVDGDRVGFSLGAYDPSRPLVIDPLVLSYSTFLGGSVGDADGYGDDAAKAIAIDSSGNAYVTGATNATDFPTTVGAYDRSRSNEQPYNNDVFVAKVNPTGTALVYSTLIGGYYDDFGTGIAVDSSGHAYVTGQTSSTQTAIGNDKFPVTSGAFSTPNNGDDRRGDVFITKLNTSGSALDYSSVFGGGDTDLPNAIALDGSNNAYVAGATRSKTSTGAFPTTLGSYQQGTAFGGNTNDGFVVKLSASGDSRVYSTLLGASGDDQLQGIAVDSSGRAYVTGFSGAFSGNDFPTTVANRYAPVDTNSTDAILTRFTADGAGLEYSTAIGTDGNGSNDGSDYAYGVALGPDAGTAYITGVSRTTGSGGADFPEKHPYEGRDGSCCFGLDLFVSEFDTDSSGANSLVYSTLIGGQGNDIGRAIAVDSDGNAYIGGSTDNFNSSDHYDTTSDELGGGSGRSSAIVTEVSQSGTSNATLGFSTTIPGGGGQNTVFGIALNDTASAIYVAGESRGSGGLTTTANAFQGSHQSPNDGFVAKIATAAGPPDTTPPTTAISSGPAAGATVTKSSVTFHFTANEPSTFQCRYDGGGFAPCSSAGPGTSGSDTRNLSEGTHTFRVRAIDTAANVDATPATRTFTVNLPDPPDRTPPQTTITKVPPSTIKSKTLPVPVSVSFVSNEAGSTFTCRLDGGAATACKSPATFKLGRGEHTIRIAARDKAGNVDATPATAQVTVKKKRRRG